MAAEPVAALGHVIEVACVKVSVMGKHYASPPVCRSFIADTREWQKDYSVVVWVPIKVNIYRTVFGNGTRSAAVYLPDHMMGEELH